MASRMFIMLVLASKMPFLANRNAELAVPPIKLRGHVEPVNSINTGTITPDKSPTFG